VELCLCSACVPSWSGQGELYSFFLPFTFLVVINHIAVIRNIVSSSRNGLSPGLS